MTKSAKRPASDLGLGGTRSVVVGAGAGIGAAIAVALSEAGSSVVIAGRSQERLSNTAGRTATPLGDDCLYTVDVRNPDRVTAFATAVLARHGVPQILVNCVGGALHKPALDVDVHEWDEIHTTHLRGTFLCCQAFAPAMRDGGYGKMINMSSTWAFTVSSGRSVYASAKAGLSHLTSALAVEWASFGIRVNALAPTTTRTPRVEQAIQEHPERERWAMERIPLGRLATPEDIVGPALFLASPLSDFVTGQTLLVDGGWVTAK